MMERFNIAFAGFNTALALWLLWRIVKVRKLENQLKHLINSRKNGTLREIEE